MDDDEKTDSIDGDDESLDIDEVLEVTANGGRPLTKAEQLGKIHRLFFHDAINAKNALQSFSSRAGR